MRITDKLYKKVKEICSAAMNSVEPEQINKTEDDRLQRLIQKYRRGKIAPEYVYLYNGLKERIEQDNVVQDPDVMVFELWYHGEITAKEALEFEEVKNSEDYELVTCLTYAAKKEG